MAAEDCEKWLNRWINNYVNNEDSPSPERKARFPLREARIEIREVPGRSGRYDLVVYTRPWLALEELTTSMRVVIRVPPEHSADFWRCRHVISRSCRAMFQVMSTVRAALPLPL